MSLMTLLIILLVFALLCGGYGQANLGWWGWSPAGVIVLVLLILWLTGRL